MIFLWTEDKTSGMNFWKFICTELFSDNVRVESKENSSKLVRAVTDLTDKNNIYIIAYDNAFDNENILRGRNELLNKASHFENIIILDIVSFEYILLTFLELEDWLQMQLDLTSRSLEVKARRALLQVMSDEVHSGYSVLPIIKEYIKSCNSKKIYTIESLVSSIMRRLTVGTGLSVDKKAKEDERKLGCCWCKGCCEVTADTSCNKVLTVADKANLLYDKTCLKEAFTQALGGVIDVEDLRI